jgi:hypothetical protein
MQLLSGSNTINQLYSPVARSLAGNDQPGEISNFNNHDFEALRAK